MLYRKKSTKTSKTFLIIQVCIDVISLKWGRVDEVTVMNQCVYLHNSAGFWSMLFVRVNILVSEILLKVLILISKPAVVLGCCGIKTPYTGFLSVCNVCWCILNYYSGCWKSSWRSQMSEWTNAPSEHIKCNQKPKWVHPQLLGYTVAKCHRLAESNTCLHQPYDPQPG